MNMKAVGIVAVSVVGALTFLTLLGKSVVEKQLKEEIAAKNKRDAQGPVVVESEAPAEPEATLGDWKKGTLSMPKASEVPTEVIQDVVPAEVVAHQTTTDQPVVETPNV